jgi:hypothetical protein
MWGWAKSAVTSSWAIPLVGWQERPGMWRWCFRGLRLHNGEAALAELGLHGSAAGGWAKMEGCIVKLGF